MIRQLLTTVALCTLLAGSVRAEDRCHVPLYARIHQAIESPIDLQNRLYKVEFSSVKLNFTGEVGQGSFDIDADPILVLHRYISGTYGSDLEGDYHGGNPEKMRADLSGYFDGNRMWICRTLYEKGEKPEVKPLIVAGFTNARQEENGTYTATLAIEERKFDGTVLDRDEIKGVTLTDITDTTSSRP